MSAEQPLWHPFLDWCEVFAGFAGYTEDGRQVLQDGADGVRLALQRPEKIEFGLRQERPWEGHHATPLCVLYDEGRYRTWYTAGPRSEEGEGADEGMFVCYAESADGTNWERPEVGLHEFAGSKANNILFPYGHFGMDSVFHDPSAAETERYKAIDDSSDFALDGQPISGQEAKDFLRSLRKEQDVQARIAKFKRLDWKQYLRGAVSPDGIRWRVLEEPIVIVPRSTGGLDTQHVADYDAENGRYVAYMRGHLKRGRCLRYSFSKDFHTGWSEPEYVYAADCQDPWDEDIYTSAYSRYPGGTHRVMFPSVYHRASDTVDIQLAVSRDGVNWTRPERRAVIDRVIGNGESGEMFGSMYACPGLMPLGSDAIGVVYMGYRHNHNQSDWVKANRPSDLGEKCYWAKWQRDRLVALEAPVGGQMTLIERPCAGGRLLANFRTETEGWLLFELTAGVPNRGGWSEAPAIPGRSFDECEPLRGDSLSQAVTWKGKADLSDLKGSSLAIRVRMERARLFALAI